MLDEQMEPTPQHHALTRHHGVPSDGQQDDATPSARADGEREELQQEPQPVRDDAERRDQQGPEVEAGVPGEVDEDEDVKLDGVVDREPEHGANTYLQDQRIPRVTSGDPSSGSLPGALQSSRIGHILFYFFIFAGGGGWGRGTEMQKLSNESVKKSYDWGELLFLLLFSFGSFAKRRRN